MHCCSRSSHAGGNVRPASRRRRARCSGRTAARRRRSARPARRFPCRRRARRVEDRDDVVTAIAQHAAHRLAVVRVGAEALSEDQVASFVGHRVPRARGWKLDAVDEPHARPRIVRDEDVAVEVDVVEQRRDVRAGSDAETGLDHAAEHAAEAERARGMRHAHSLANAARLRELDVDPVRAVGARGDVRKRVAVLVDVDRDRRAPFSFAPSASPAGSGCSQYCDAELCELRQRVERLVERPRLVDVHLQRHVAATPRTARTRSTSRPSRPPSFSLSRLKRSARPSPRGAPCRRDRRARSSSSSAGRRAAGRAAGTRAPHELPLEVVQRCVDRRARRELALREARHDLLERERVVAEQLRHAPRRTPAPTPASPHNARWAPPRRARARRCAALRPRRRAPRHARRAR